MLSSNIAKPRFSSPGNILKLNEHSHAKHILQSRGIGVYHHVAFADQAAKGCCHGKSHTK